MNDQTLLLPCGRSIDDLWHAIDQPPDPHTLECPHCQAGRVRLAKLRQATAELRIVDATDPTLRPSSRTKQTVMDIARVEVRRSRRLPMIVTTPGADQPVLQISEQAVSAVVRRAADRVVGVHARRCRITPQLPPPTSSPTSNSDRSQPERPPAGSPITVDIQLRIAVSPSTDIGRSQVLVRDAVINAVQQQVGIQVHRVDLVVEDIFDE